MKKTLRKIISYLPTIFVIFSVIFCFVKYIENNKIYATHENCLDVFYLDVGQGDCAYIKLPDGEDMLIDAGEDDIDSYITLEKFNIDDFEYLIMTHPHTDHIGGIMDILDEYEVENVIMPESDYETKTYQNILDEIEKKDIKITYATAGTFVLDTENLDIEILSPDSSKEKEINNLSAIIKITYKENEFLFTGDVEQDRERKIKGDVSADVLKVAHHGSKTSSSAEFLNKVNPEYAIISVGKNNSYGHPHYEVINRLNKIGAKIFRTDENGTIHVCADGETIKINAESLD